MSSPLFLESSPEKADLKVDRRRRLARMILPVKFGLEVVDCGGAGFHFCDNVVLFGDGHWERMKVEVYIMRGKEVILQL